MLVHTLEEEGGETSVRIVVPVDRCTQILRLAHSTLTDGHFSHKKTQCRPEKTVHMARYRQECSELVFNLSTLPEGRKAYKSQSPSETLTRDKNSVHRIAFDLVGSLPRTKRGHQYLLTFICLSSKYPETIALKRVDAVSLAEAMVDVFSRIVIPCEMLTDQGSVFMGRLTKELCGLLNIDHLIISPYHPQTDGCLEHWHGSLMHIFGKCEDSKAQWVIILKYFLFACRRSPHSNTGFSPFEIIFDKPARGPLDVLRECWLEGEVQEVYVVAWVNKLSKRLKEMMQVVCEKERLAKERMKKHYDKNAKLREFNEGTLVLVRTPDLAGKLEDIWEGSYEITRSISSVTYELAVPTRRTKKRVFHSNMLKSWKSPDAPVFQVIVAEEDECENDQPGHVGEDLVQKQTQELQVVLKQFGDVICETTGMAHDTDLGIDIGEHTPIKSVPYQLAPAWKEQLRVKVLSFLEQGIIRPS